MSNRPGSASSGENRTSGCPSGLCWTVIGQPGMKPRTKASALAIVLLAMVLAVNLAQLFLFRDEERA